jgi:hypothetical protein
MEERPVLPRKPGNAGGGKGPWFKGDAGRSEGEEIGVSLRTPESVWKLQAALAVTHRSNHGKSGAFDFTINAGDRMRGTLAM